MRLALISAAALVALPLAACNKPAQNEAAEAAEAVPGDSNTMGEAVNDLAAADAAAFAGAENRYDAAATANTAVAEDAGPGPDANGSGDDEEIVE